LPQPLDKQKALVYGQLVEAAYAMFKAKNVDPLKPEPLNIPDDYELGAWIHMSDFILTLKEPQFYGIVVHEKKDTDSRVIAIRGTEHIIEWIDDAAALPVPFRQVPSCGRVASGFDRIYGSLKIVKRHLPIVSPAPEQSAPAATAPASETFTGSFAEQLDQEVRSREAARGQAAPEGRTRRHRPTVVTGHSLGAALATLFVMENASKGKFDITTVCTFASPRVGDMEFVHTFNQIPIDSWRIVNSKDWVPKLPFHIPVLADYGHVDASTDFDSTDFAKPGPVCWHDMGTYLRGIDANSPVSPSCALNDDA
jgi:hypothetical protein